MEFIDLKKQYSVLKDSIDSNIATVLKNGNFIGGSEINELSKQLSAYCGTQYALTCANGTDALTLALRTIEAGENDAIFVPSFTFFASAEAISLEKASPIFVDVDFRTFNIDPIKLKKAIIDVQTKTDLKPKAVLTVDLFGLPANYPEIKKIADQYGLLIIEDSAQGFGGSINGQKACSFGDIATTSFFPAKPLGCYGDGGAIFTDNENYYRLLQSYAVHGKGSYKYDNVRIGYNSRLDSIQAAILLPKLEAFRQHELHNRNRIAKAYSEKLSPHFLTPLVPEGFESSWAQYTLILDSTEQRTQIQERLKAKGIPTMIYYPKPMHKQTAYTGYAFNTEDLTVSETLSECVMSIPMHPYLSDEEVDCITRELIEAKRSI